MEKGDRLRLILALLFVALGLRVCNLGTFSLWLDEVFQLRLAEGTVTDVWSRAAAVEENPPLSALVMSLGNSLGFPETGHRLISVTLGVLSILVLVVWARCRFGDRVALVSGWLAALSPFHLRYSQELRSYPFFLFFAMLSILLFDRFIEESTPLRGIVFSLSFAAGLYTHSLFPFVLAPIAARLLCVDGLQKVRIWITAAGAVLLGIVLWIPWVPHLLRAAGTTAEPTAQAWTWRAVARRWQFYTAGGWEGADLSWGGVLLACLAVVGIARAVRSGRSGGVEVLVGALVGIVGVELVFHFVLQRWSVGRYTIIGWPFLIVLMALGIEPLLQSKIRVLRTAPVVVLAVILLGGVFEYYERGRPHWDRLAEVIREVHRDDEPVLTANIFCQYCVDYYLNLAGDHVESKPSIPVLPVDRDLDRLLDLWPREGSCLLVRGGTPQSPEIRRVAAYFPMIVSSSSGQWLYRLLPRERITVLPDWDLLIDQTQPYTQWSSPSLVQLPPHLRDLRGLSLVAHCKGVFAPPVGDEQFLDFDRRSTAANLRSGWSGFETDPEGVSFAWATGIEAGIFFSSRCGGPCTLRMRLWPLPVPGRTQQVRVFVNGYQIGLFSLSGGRQTIEARAPASVLNSETNLLVMQFAHATAPATIDATSTDRRPLACAFDWIAFAQQREIESAANSQLGTTHSAR